MSLPKIEDARKLSNDELAAKILSSKRELFHLRFKNATGQLRKKHLIKHKKHEISQLLTVERERNLITRYSKNINYKKQKEIELYQSKVDAFAFHALNLAEKNINSEVENKVKNGKILINMLLEVKDKNWQGDQISDYQEHERYGNFISFFGSKRTIEELQKDDVINYVSALKSGQGFDVEVSESFSGDSERNDSDSKGLFVVPLIRADSIHERERGDKAIIAFIDDGIDIFHNAFVKINSETARRETRILEIYDLSAERVYEKPQIEAYLNNLEITEDGMDAVPDNLRNTPKGHGSKVIGIAAGHQAGEFPGGIAPEAQIVVVILKNQKNPLDHAKALEYIENISIREKLPVVVNVCSGNNLGSHDGISPLERKYENFINNNSQLEFIVVKSAGNLAQSSLHASYNSDNMINKGILIWQSSSIETNASEGIQLWFDHRNKFKLKLSYGNTVVEAEKRVKNKQMSSSNESEWLGLTTDKFTGEERLLEYLEIANYKITVSYERRIKKDKVYDIAIGIDS